MEALVSSRLTDAPENFTFILLGNFSEVSTLLELLVRSNVLLPGVRSR